LLKKKRLTANERCEAEGLYSQSYLEYYLNEPRINVQYYLKKGHIDRPTHKHHNRMVYYKEDLPILKSQLAAYKTTRITCADLQKRWECSKYQLVLAKRACNIKQRPGKWVTKEQIEILAKYLGKNA
jgi:hypothetical protein